MLYISSDAAAADAARSKGAHAFRVILEWTLHRQPTGNIVCVLIVCFYNGISTYSVGDFVMTGSRENFLDIGRQGDPNLRPSQSRASRLSCRSWRTRKRRTSHLPCATGCFFFRLAFLGNPPTHTALATMSPRNQRAGSVPIRSSQCVTSCFASRHELTRVFNIREMHPDVPNSTRSCQTLATKLQFARVSEDLKDNLQTAQG